MVIDSVEDKIGNKEIVANIFRGYLAGFFDAEGMVRLDDEHAEPEVSIKQTYLRVLELINCKFEGRIETLKSKNEHKQAFRWRSSHGITKLHFLEHVYPILIEKRKQVELVIHYLKEVKTERNYFKLPKIQKQYREWLIKELGRLKHEKYDERELKNYDNELKKLRIPKDVRECRQNTLIPLEEIYRENGIDYNKEIADNINFIPDISKYELVGYFSGFFDGEGYVGIEKGQRDSYTLFVVITNSNYDILNLYQKRFGGDIRPSNDKYMKEYHKKKWKWYITNNYTIPFLKYILRWTIVKKSQIYEAIKFQEWHNKIGVINTIEKKRIADSYMLKLKELKKDTGEDIDNLDRESYTNKNDKRYCQISIEKAWG